MKKAFYILMTALISFVFLCACEPKNPQDEIVKLNIPKEGVVKFAYLPTDDPPTNGGETTDQNLIDEIIDKLNEHDYHVEIIKDGHHSGYVYEEKRIRITYENGSTIEFDDGGGTMLRKSDGPWLERTDSKFKLRDYLVEKLNFKLNPDSLQLDIPEESVESISYIIMRLPDLKIEAIKDPQELKSLVFQLNMMNYYICTYRTEFPAPRGVFVIKYLDGSEIRYLDADRFLRRQDGGWLEQCSSGGFNNISDILGQYFALTDDIIYGK